MRRLLMLGCALLLTTAQANERPELQQVRFSAGSNRVMVVTVGGGEGSGINSATLQVLNVWGGVLYRSTHTPSTSLPTGTLVAQLLNKPPNPAKLSAFGLRPGVLSTPRFQRGYPGQNPSYSEAVLAGGTQLTNVALWSVPVPITVKVFARPGACPTPALLNGHAAAGLQLKVRNQVIFTDAMLPSVRKCAVGYTLDRVDVRGNRVLFTVRSYSFGFEGPDATPVFIAAVLN